MLIRSGKRFCIEAGHYRSSDVVDRAVQDALGLRMARSLRHARVGAVGGPFEGRGDFAVSPEHLRRELGVEMPITDCVVALLDGRLKPVEAVAALMGRDPKGELL